MLIFCSLYVFDQFPDSSTFPFQPLFLLACTYFFALFDWITYFRYKVGKSTPCYIIESFVSWDPLLEGMLSFLLSLYSPYSLSWYIERYRDIEILMRLFLCKIQVLYVYLSALFLFVHHLHSLSSWYILYTYDSSNISMIESCIHGEETKSLCTQFQFLPLEV